MKVEEKRAFFQSEDFYDEIMKNIGSDGFFYLIVSQEEGEWLSKDDAARKRRFADAVIKIFPAAAHFAKVSPLATDIAKIVNETPEEIFNWAKTPLWKQAVKYYGWHGNPTPQEELLSETDPVPLRESFLIHKVFQKEEGSCIRFETYDCAINARVKYIDRYHFVLWDGADNEQNLEKLNIVLAFPEDRMPFVKKGIKRRQGVADLGLRPIEKLSERPKVNTVAPLGSIVECVMRNGLVVVGEKVWDSQYYMVMRVGGPKGKGGKIIIVYKHALLAFQVIKQGQKRKKRYRDDWDNEENPNR